jgi:hypothetical protein
MPSTLGAATAARPAHDAPARGAAGAPAGKIAMLPIAGVDDTSAHLVPHLRLARGLQLGIPDSHPCGPMKNR